MSNAATTSEAVAPVATAQYEVVLVTYHSRGPLLGFLEAVRPDQRLVVVDNASGVDGVPEVVDGMAHGRWIDGANSGFACAANRGARTSTAEFLVFANPDSRPTPEIWEALVADLVNDPGLGTVAAATVDGTGRIEIGVGGWEPTVLRTAVYAFGLHRIFPTAGVYARPDVGQDISLGWLTGACMAIRRDTFMELGGFEERYFLYSEDIAFGRRLREAGLGQRLRTDLLVPHATGGSGGGGSRMPQQKGASLASYLADHNGPVSTTAMRTLLVVGMLPRIVIAVLRGRRAALRHHLAYVRGVATKRSPDWS